MQQRNGEGCQEPHFNQLQWELIETFDQFTLSVCFSEIHKAFGYMLSYMIHCIHSLACLQKHLENLIWTPHYFCQMTVIVSAHSSVSSKSPCLCIICVIYCFVNIFMFNKILQRRTFDESDSFSGVISIFLPSLTCILLAYDAFGWSIDISPKKYCEVTR